MPMLPQAPAYYASPNPQVFGVAFLFLGGLIAWRVYTQDTRLSMDSRILLLVVSLLVSPCERRLSCMQTPRACTQPAANLALLCVQVLLAGVFCFLLEHSWGRVTASWRVPM